MAYYHFNSDFVSNSQQPFVKSLLNCKDFSQSDRLLGSSTGRGITWFLDTKAELAINSVLRHYYRGGLFGKVIKDSYLFNGIETTRAYQEFKLLKQLCQWNIPVPHPLALKIQRFLCFYQADILLGRIDNTQDLSQFLQISKLTTQQYRAIGQLIRQLHDHQVHHSDLNIHNILIGKNDGKFWLIDFDKCQIQSGEEWKKDNLSRLKRSFDKEKERLNIHFSEKNWDALLKGYNSLTN
ncbi:3-deoxy-D-manno-octulosonic acid kinase [Otariodibacter oris]|uniref:3-deoxy-D-manno-octulosonic acid kinase n=1 Tax=Otariodibacter oris TaxID=1032623 RepID=A0A420XJT6_9PAST|nr:3-deoxy-D-manno-octulosonic acid kinase [Otariodibacter oris]QGM80490.1 3-deoxy-D-manno-octulosonic acid kinase [Otariodibacter oris]RKR77360.1 3-deoxy-D-manno-octulosonic acid kinase [Otariodibacter oris]